MFGELPKALDQRFLMAYFLPSTVFLLALRQLLAEFGLLPTLQLDTLLASALVGLAALFIGALLAYSNRFLFMRLEGYWPDSWRRVFVFWERRRYQRLREKLSRLNEEYRSLKKESKDIPSSIQEKRADLMC